MLGDSLRRRHPEPEREGARREREPTRRRGRFGLRHWLVAALVILGGSFIAGYLISTRVLFPVPETAGTGVAVPDLRGIDREEAGRRLADAGLVAGDVVELVNRELEPGRVVAQDPVAGQLLRPGGEVSYVVSTGAAQARIPPLTGLDVIAAQALLERAGLDVELRQTRTGEVRRRAVVTTDPPAGTVVRLPATITLIVSAGPATQDSLSAPDDSLPGAATGSGTGGP